MANNYYQPHTSRLKKYSSYSNPPPPETQTSQAANQSQGMYPSPALNQSRGMNPTPATIQGQGGNPWQGTMQGQGTGRPTGMYQIPGRKLPPEQNQGMGTNTGLDNQQSPGMNQASVRKPLPGKQTQDMNAQGQNSVAQDKQVMEYRAATNNVALYFSSAPKEKAEGFSQERLQEAILWSEILGKPVSKRRKRRMQ